VRKAETPRRKDVKATNFYQLVTQINADTNPVFTASGGAGRAAKKS
jgi:hypothetical protein